MLFGAYTLGKSQELVAILNDAGIENGKIRKLDKLYENLIVKGEY